MRLVRLLRRILAPLVALALVLPLPAAFAVRAATITVNTTADTIVGGSCSLRGAIQAINLGTAQGGCPTGIVGDTIMFNLPAGPQTITLAGSELLIDQNMTIAGPGANLLTVSGNNAVRVFRPRFAGFVTISGLTVTRGRAIDIGGSILSNGTLTLNDCVVTNNRVAGTSNTLNGGAGIFNDGTLVLNRTLVTSNIVEAGSGTAVKRGGGIYNYDGNYSTVRLTLNASTVSDNTGAVEGGGIASINRATATLSGSQVDRNSVTSFGGGIASIGTGTLSLTDSTANSNIVTAGSGGGLYTTTATTLTRSHVDDNIAGSFGGGILEAGSLTITDSSVSRNRAQTAFGGGISNQFDGILTITGSTIAGNSARLSGGGVDNFGMMTMTNSTVSGNRAEGSGGGMWISNRGTVTGSTISGNTADNGGGVAHGGSAFTLANSTISSNTANLSGGGLSAGGTSFTMRSITVAGNRVTGGNGGGIAHTFGTVDIGNALLTANTASGSGPDYFYSSGTRTDLGYNFVAASAGVAWTALGDITGNTDPVVGPLTDNSGPTPTRPLLSGSVAVDAGGSTLCADPLVGNVDQRGVMRPQGEACDIGASEYQPVSPALSGVPNIGTAGQSIMLTGTGFQRNTRVTLEGQPVLVQSVSVDGTRLNVRLVEHAAGYATFVLTNPGPNHTVTFTLRYVPPADPPPATRPAAPPPNSIPPMRSPLVRVTAPPVAASTPTPLPAPVRRVGP